MVWKFLLESCHFLQIQIAPILPHIVQRHMCLLKNPDKQGVNLLAKITCEFLQLVACFCHSKTVWDSVSSGGLYRLWKSESPAHDDRSHLSKDLVTATAHMQAWQCSTNQIHQMEKREGDKAWRQGVGRGQEAWPERTGLWGLVHKAGADLNQVSDRWGKRQSG